MMSNLAIDIQVHEQEKSYTVEVKVQGQIILL